MGNQVRSIALPLALVAAAMAIIAMAAVVEAGHRDIVGDWVITGGLTRVDGDTLNVSGNVTVTGGGVLELHNCTLSIDWSADGERGVNVTPTGRLLVYDSTIEGGNARMGFVLRGDSTFERVSISHVAGASWPESGIDLLGGDISIRNSTIGDGGAFGLVVKTNLTLDSVTIGGVASAILIQNRGVAGPFSVTITGCDLRSGQDGTGTGIYLDAVQHMPKVTLDIKGTAAKGYGTGINLNEAGDSDAQVVGCSLLGDTVGAQLFAFGGNIAFRDNRIGHREGPSAIGLAVYETGSGKLTLGPNIIEDTETGCIFDAYATVVSGVSYGHLTVANCTLGIVAQADFDSDMHLTIHNSTVTNCTTDFAALGQGDDFGGTIIVRDTVHVVGSGKVEGARSWIWSYAKIDIGTVSWKGDGRIAQGWLVLEDDAGKQIARFDIYAPEPRSIIGWELNTTRFVKHVYLWPAIYVSGHRFGGEMVDIWTRGRIDVELVDDVAPEVGIDQGGLAYLNITSLAVTGNYTDLGSGVAVLQSSLDGAAFANFTSFHDGTWTLPLIDLADGPHNLSVRALDAVGNIGITKSWSFVVDTVRPIIEISPPPGLVNTSTVLLRGRTEPGSTMTVSGLPYAVAPDGTFAAVVPLVDGDNVLVVLVVDRAGNTNATRFLVRSDTLLPLLTVDAPRDGTWTNARQVVVEGMTEPGVELRMNGEGVTETGGEFQHTMGLATGTFTIRVTAKDAANNTAVVVLVLHVDWTVPVITIDSPAGGTLVTRDKETYIDGTVDDPSIDHVTINGQDVMLVSGMFVHLCALSEGVNAYNISVEDQAGNANSTVVTITRDTVAPTYIVGLIPVGGRLVTLNTTLYSTARAVDVHIVADETVIVDLAGNATRPRGSDVWVRVDLREGQNDIAFTLEDLAANPGPDYGKRLFLDTTPPPILILEPTSGLRTSGEVVVVYGRTEIGCHVSVGGAQVVMLPLGEFRQVVTLKEGRNDIRVESVDPMGNVNSTVVSVDREAKGPVLGGATYIVALVGIIIVVALVAMVYTILRRRR